MKLFKNIKPITQFLCKTSKIFIDFILPLATTALLWSFLDKAVQILAVLVLFTMFLKNIGVNVNIVDRIKNGRIRQFLKFIMRSSTPVAKMDEEYFEETAKLIADQTKNVVKATNKMKEEITNMSKLKALRKELVLFLTNNKKATLSVIVFTLFFADYFFNFTGKYGIPKEALYTIAAGIYLLILFAISGEGFTGNVINRLRNETKVAKKATKKMIKKYQSEKKKKESRKEFLLTFAINDKLPPDKGEEYRNVVKDIKFYENEIDKLIKSMEDSLEDEEEVD